MRVAVVLLAAACAALTLCAAAPAANAGYGGQLRPVEVQLSGVLVTLKKLAAKSVVFPAPPNAAIKAADAVDVQRATLRSAGSRLAALSPPSSVSAEHAHLRSAAGSLNMQLGKAAKRLRAGWLIDAGKLPRLSGARELAAALAALERAGYPVARG